MTSAHAIFAIYVLVNLAFIGNICNTHRIYSLLIVPYFIFFQFFDQNFS